MIDPIKTTEMYSVKLEDILKYSIPRSNGCIEWLRYVNPRGYGTLRCGNFKFRVHRVVYFLSKQLPYDEDLIIMHLCNNRICINMEHLTGGTQKENVEHSIALGNHTSFKAKMNPYCNRGHLYGVENTRYTKNGHRECRICDSEDHRIKR